MCPECGESKHVYYGGSWCASCGWHLPSAMTQHANFERDDRCGWCVCDG